MDDRRIKVREIAEALGILKECVCHMNLTEKLGMRKLFVRWVPCLLILGQKRIGMNISKTPLERFKRNKSDFWRRLVTVDEIWVHHYIPESKEQSKQWKDEHAPKTVSLAGKIMATVFWDTHGIVFIDYLEKGKTIMGVYYVRLKTFQPTS